MMMMELFLVSLDAFQIAGAFCSRGGELEVDDVPLALLKEQSALCLLNLQPPR